MIYITVLVWAINLLNVWYLMLLPCYRAFRLSQLFNSQDKKIEFMPERDREVWFWHKMGIHNEGVESAISCIRCRLWYDDTSYYEWMMTEDGEMLAHLPGDKKSWLSRQCVRHRTLAMGGPLKHNINRTHSTLGVVGWVIKRQVSADFILSKLGGFASDYDIVDDMA
jgi:hypothetical protein